MHTLKWSNDFVLGIDEIDQQHQALVEKIKALDALTHVEPGEHTTRQLLADLTDYVREHFLLEECLMAKGRCSTELVFRHRVEHAYFRSVLKDVKSDFEGGRATVTISLIEYLVNWLLHHIVVVDREMASELKVADPKFDRPDSGTLARQVTDELTESERHLFAELRRAYGDLEDQVGERTRVLMDRNRALEMELREMTAKVTHLSQDLEAVRRQ